MDRLWSPWRMEYIEAPQDEGSGCLFCDKSSATEDEENFVLARAGRAFAILNAFPYNPGHLMVAPLRHVAELEELEPDELADADRLLQRAVRALKDASDPHGFNLGLNLGRVAGAGIPGHVHWHVVPRWNGDTNFITVLGATRVLPEALAATYAKLKPLFG